MITRRTGLFETNSSSVHVLTITKGPETKEEIFACIPNYLKPYLEKYGIVFGSGKEWNDPSYEGNRDVREFQEKLDRFWNNITSTRLCYFMRNYNFLREALQHQPYKFTLNIDPDFLETHDFGDDEYWGMMSDSGTLNDEIKLFRFIFCPESGFHCYDRDYWEPEENEDDKIEVYYENE